MALACPEPVEYPVGNSGWVEFVLSLPVQDACQGRKEEPMMLVGTHPTEWDLPKKDREELMMLVGMYPTEWEKRAREVRERLAKAGQARPRCTVSPAGEPGQARPKASPFGRLVAALR